MDVLIVAVCCFGGAALAGLIGFLKENTPWDTRKYLVTLFSGVSTAVVFALAYQFNEDGLSVYDILAAIGAGAGVDNLVNRVSGYVSKPK